jgi:uncharacterized cysteine cluster protein YcgN (CxxCxxCC family)
MVDGGAIIARQTPPLGICSVGAKKHKMQNPFWKTKRLEELTNAEWESLCDGCGLCCLNKLEDWDTGEVAFTSVACRLLDGESCRCSDYENRKATVPDCIQLTPDSVRDIPWLPPTCGYRLMRDGEDLYWWHPLVSGDPDTVHQAGISAKGRTVSEEHVEVDDFEDYLVDWPLFVGDRAQERR